MENYKFTTSHLKEGFHGRILTGSVFTIGAQLVMLLIQIGTTACLARLLSPDDFGLVALSVTFTGFIAIFRDLGLSMATVQRDELTHYQASNLFWINVFFSCGLALIIALGAPLFSSFYKDPKLLDIIIVSGASLIISGFTVQHQALLRRLMFFRSLALIDVISRLLGGALAVFWAWYDASYWSLVFMPIFSAVFYAAGVWIRCRWRPVWFHRGAGTWDMLKFGRNMLHYGIVNYFARNSDSLIIGKVAGIEALGYYNRSYALMLMPIGQLVAPLTGVAVSGLSRLQNDENQFAGLYLRIIKFIAIVSFGITSAMYLFTNEIIDIFLGPQWGAAKGIFAVLCFAAVWQPLLSTTSWVLTSLNRTDRIVTWGYINSISLIATFFIGSQFGVYGIATAYAIYMWLIFIPNLLFVFRRTPVRLMAFLKTVRIPFLCMIISVPLLDLLRRFLMSFWSQGLSIAVLICLEILLWGGLLLADSSVRNFIKQFIANRPQ